MTLIKHDRKDDSKDELFLDHQQIPRANFQYDHDKSTVMWKHGSGNNFSAGHVHISNDGSTGSGSIQIGDQRIQKSVTMQHSPPTYNVSLSSNAGATLVDDHLKWDTNLNQWKTAKWADDVLAWSYVQKEQNLIGKTGYYTEVTFKDPKADSETWKCDDSGNPFGNDQCTTLLDSAGRFYFEVSANVTPPTYSRPASTEDGIKTVFPYRMTFDFDVIAFKMTGAMLINSNDGNGQVLALKGESTNQSIVGNYILRSSEGVPTAQFGVSNGKLLVDNKEIKSSAVKGSTLFWSDIPKDFASKSGLPTNGSMAFSKMGRSAKVQGLVKPHTAERYMSPRVAAAQSLNLSIYGLLNMDPHGEVGGGDKKSFEDIVQNKSLGDFYKIIQYFMDKSYREDFISANPPDIHDVQDIADDNPSENSTFYKSLQVPYLTNALSSSTEHVARKLNARRAAKWLKTSIANNSVFKSQSTKLYARQWQLKFPIMHDYLLDQIQNASAYSEHICQDAANYISQLKNDVGDDPDQKTALQEIVTKFENLRDYAIGNDKYWAYALFRVLTSNQYLSKLKLQMTSGNTSQQIVLDIKRFTAILSILDPSNQFANEFLTAIKLYQLISVVPELIDYAGSKDDFINTVMKILEEFAQKYVDSENPEIANQAAKIANAIKEGKMNAYIQVFYSSSQGDAAASNFNWERFVLSGGSKLAKVLGSNVNPILGSSIALATATAGIVFLATGAIHWDDLSGIQKAKFIKSLVSNFAYMLKNVVSNSMKAYAAFELYSSKLGVAKVFFTGKGLVAVDEAEQFYSSGFSKWLVKQGAVKYSEGNLVWVEVTSELQETYPRMTKAFGRNLNEFMSTRFAAAMAIVNIVLSAMALANDHTTMDEARDGLFLGSGVMQLVSAAAGWVAGAIVAEASTVTVLSTIAGLASALGIVAAVAGTIIMLIIIFTHKDPPTPLEMFVERDAKNAGYYMAHETDIDYFDQISDRSGNSKTTGVTVKYDGDNNKCLHAHQSGDLGYGIVTYSYDSVLIIETDENGYTKFFTLLYSPDTKKSKVVSLTLNNGNVSMSESTDDRNKQLWIAECRGQVKKDSDGDVEEAAFFLKNLASSNSGSNDYLSIENDRVTISSDPVPWLLSMTGTKPQWLYIDNISLTTNDQWEVFYIRLVQPGSDDQKLCIVNPSLPSWLKLDTDHLQIKQTGDKPPAFTKTSYTVQVKNRFGSTGADFTIEVTQSTSI